MHTQAKRNTFKFILIVCITLCLALLFALQISRPVVAYASENEYGIDDFEFDDPYALRLILPERRMKMQ